MKSTLIVGIGASLLTAGIAKAQQRQDITPRTPNVLFIYADDLGYGDLECYDGTQVKTPNINRLAKNGIRFTNAHATASTSTPSRYSMLTGEYAWRRPGTDIAAGNAGMIIRPERYTIADMFKNAGYATAAIGKWHLGLGDKAGEQDWNAPLPTALGDLGFDYSYIMAATADRVPCVFIENGQVANYDPDAPFGNFGDAYAINSRRHYYANITFIDDQVGQIIQTLKDKGMYDNALICFTADHGDMLGDHYHWRKTYPYEGSAHIPYIVKWPAGISKSIPDGSSIEQPVELRDFLPTFIDIAGGSVPPDMDGRSLLKLIQGQQEQWRPYIDMEHATCYSDDNYWAALTDGKIKYIWNFHNGSEQLFDLREDPGETHNLSEDAAYQNKLSELRKMMVEHLSERGDSFVKDGKLMTLDTTLLYSPNFPK